MAVRKMAAILFLSAGAAHGAFIHYVGQLGARSVLLAWGDPGTTGNTIGRDSSPLGQGVVRMAGRSVGTRRNWVIVDSLNPDTVYPYEIEINGQKRATGQIRTWQEHSDHFCFFAIGDYGTGRSPQYAVADAMVREFAARERAGCPVRFVITLGDNIYADFRLGLTAVHSGDQDAAWESKFFRPYQKIIEQIPFLPTLGNHDGNTSENRGDLSAWLDNFFFPNNIEETFYTFTYGDFAQFFALDSTTNTLVGPLAPRWARGGKQDSWLRSVLPSSTVAWKIPYLHHPIYDAGPEHRPAYVDLKDWVELFEKSGVRVVFSGHEHNLQFSDPAVTGGILYVIAGSGGELSPGHVRKEMRREHIAAWAPVREFLSIEVQGREMRITPISSDRFELEDPQGKPVGLPVLVTAQ